MSRTSSERWFRLLLRLYPVDFREELAKSVVEAYSDRARDAQDWLLIKIHPNQQFAFVTAESPDARE